MADFRLRNGVRIPKIGLGTSHTGGYSHEAVVCALRDVGYRLIDTAKRYGNERLLGCALEKSQCPRETLFLTSKLWPTDYGGWDDVKLACKASCTKLGTDYLDLYIMHWPLVPTGAGDCQQIIEETWRSMEKLLEEDSCRCIGVSNFTIPELNHLMDNAAVVPHVQQSEFHVLNTSVELRHFCAENGIQFEGYCPLGRGKLLGEPAVVELAHSYNRTPAQLLLRWSIQSDAVTIPKSTDRGRLKENFTVFDFEITAQDMAVLDSLNINQHCINRSAVQEDIDLPDGYRLTEKLV